MTARFNNEPQQHVENFPIFLQDYDSLAQHFRAQLEGLSTTDKGDKFAQFVKRLVPQLDIGANFNIPRLNDKKSRDEGIDLIAKSPDSSSVLYIQAKLWVDRSEVIDSVLSKFQSYLNVSCSVPNEQFALFPKEGRNVHFMIVTLSSLGGIIRSYEKHEFASKPFYTQYFGDKRLHIIDGRDIFSVLRSSYSKVNQVPRDLNLRSEVPIVCKDNVYLGIISSETLKRIYGKFGDALFFENIRDFLVGCQANIDR